MTTKRSVGVIGKDLKVLLEEMASVELVGAELGDAVIATQEIAAIANAVHTALLARFDTSPQWAIDGAKSPAAWVAWKCRIPRGRAHAALRCGRALRTMPRTEEAMLGGRIGPDHVRVLAAAREVAPDLFASHEAELVALGDRLSFVEFEIAVRYWRQLANPDGDEASADRRFESRGVHCSQTIGGMGALDGSLDPMGFAIFNGELRRLEQLEFDADWREARDRFGEGAFPSDLRRTAPQRRHDALIEMARRSAAKPADAKEARTLLTVLAGEESLARICELSNRTVVTPGEVARVLTDVDVERIVFDGPSRILDVGVRQRLFTGATRRAVEVRDRVCAHDSCDDPAEDCQIDHVIPYEDGGLTVQENGRPYCGWHHRWRHGQTGPP